MTDPVSELVEVLARHSGIDVGHRLPALRSAIERVGDGMEVQQLLELAADPHAGADLLDRLADEVTVNETFFMRHRAELDAIPWSSLLDHARRRGRGGLRVWSAGCASGEEVYSLAILAIEALPGEPTPVSVLGTDISRACLASAAEGSYGARSMRHVEPMLRRRHFHDGSDGVATVGRSVRRHVRFARHSLVRDQIPPAGELAFDVIVCRNVLIYFNRDTATNVVERLQSALDASGMLVLGATDRLALTRPVLTSGPPEDRLRPARLAEVTALRAKAPERAGAGASAMSVDGQARIALALEDADAGRFAAALSGLSQILAADPLHLAALCIQGLVLHSLGDPASALHSLRRAVYLDPAFARAAFELGRAQDALGDRAAARRAYRQALDVLDNGPARDQGRNDLDVGVADACRRRLAIAEEVER